MGPSATIPSESQDSPNDLEAIDLTGDGEYDMVKLEEAGPVKEVGPWRNAFQHTRTAAGNVYSASRRFSFEVYNSGMGRATGAVMYAGLSSLRHASQRFQNRSPASGAREFIARDILGDHLADTLDDSNHFRDVPQLPILNRRATIETVPIAVMGHDIDPQTWTDAGERQTSFLQERTVIAGPAQRRFMSSPNVSTLQQGGFLEEVDDEIPTLINHPQSLPTSHTRRQTGKALYRPLPPTSGPGRPGPPQLQVMPPASTRQKDKDGFVTSPTTSGAAQAESDYFSHHPKPKQLEGQPREYGSFDIEESSGDDEFFGIS